MVRASGAHLGAVLDPGGEHVTIVDDKGHVLTDDEALLVLLQMVTETTPPGAVALPVAVSRAAEGICAEAGRRDRLDQAVRLQPHGGGGHRASTFAASQNGGFIFPHFLPAFDAAATLVNLVAMLTKTDQRLSTMVAGLPRVHIAHHSVHTPWEQKGMLMRTLVERVGDASWSWWTG